MTNIDAHSSTWLAIKEWAKQEQERLMRELRQGGDDDDKHRGALDQLDALLALEEPPPKLKIAQRVPMPAGL